MHKGPRVQSLKLEISLQKNTNSVSKEIQVKDSILWVRCACFNFGSILFSFPNFLKDVHFLNLDAADILCKTLLPCQIPEICNHTHISFQQKSRILISFSSKTSAQRVVVASWGTFPGDLVNTTQMDSLFGETQMESHWSLKWVNWNSVNTTFY